MGVSSLSLFIHDDSLWLLLLLLLAQTICVILLAVYICSGISTRFLPAISTLPSPARSSETCTTSQHFDFIAPSSFSTPSSSANPGIASPALDSSVLPFTPRQYLFNLLGDRVVKMSVGPQHAAFVTANGKLCKRTATLKSPLPSHVFSYFVACAMSQIAEGARATVSAGSTSEPTAAMSGRIGGRCVCGAARWGGVWRIF